MKNRVSVHRQQAQRMCSCRASVASTGQVWSEQSDEQVKSRRVERRVKVSAQQQSMNQSMSTKQNKTMQKLSTPTLRYATLHETEPSCRLLQ